MRFIREKVYRFFVVITALVSAHVSLAQDITQNPTVQAALSSTLEHVSMGTTRVPTGYLLDRAFEVADLRSFSGDSLSVYNYADVGVFRNCLLTINSSRVNTNGAEIDGNAAVNAMQDSTAVLLSAAVFQYNYIVANAVTDNLITLIGGKLYDKRKNGVLQNPFSSAYMFVMSPGVIAHTGTSVHYKFSTSRLYGNCTVQSIQFDAGDGNGYVTLTNNSYDNTVNYSAVGTKELKMRVTLSGGKVLLGHALIEIEDYVSSPSGTATSPDHEFIVSLPSDTSVKAKVSYKYAPNHSGIIKPFVFVEGFDVFGGSSGYGNLDFPWFYDSVLTNDTFKNEYDIVYVDWANPTADITHNAELLKIILSSINTNKHNNNSQEKNIIVGHSMGGLVARYALRTMELGNIPHETKCYVSYDSPHLGVNVPLGLQYTVRDAHWLLSGSGGNVGLVQLIAYNILSDLVAIYESPSAKQMMYYYVDSSGNLLTTYHDSWQQMLDSIGFPEGDPGTDIENLSIVNGAPYENLSSHFADVSFWYNVFDFSQLLNLWFPFISVGNVSATFNIERNQGNGCVVSSSQATYYKTHLFGLTEDCSLFGANGRIHYAPSGSVGYDIIPSSYLPTGSFSDFSFAGFSAQIQDTVAFVPAASAVSVPEYSRNYYNTPPTPSIETPFDGFYINRYAQEHMGVDSGYWTWLYNQAGLSIYGPDKYVSNGAPYYAFKPGGGTPLIATWTTSNTDVAYFTNNTLHVLGTGPFSIHVNSNEPSSSFYATYFKRLDVFAGIPDQVLSKSYKGNNTYQITAQCADTTLRSVFSKYVANGTFSYVWGYKVGSNSIVWSSPSSSSTYQYQTSNNDAVTIYCRLKTCTNSYGNWVNIQIQKENHDYFCHDPQAVYVGDLHLWYDCETIDYIPDETMPTGRRRVTFLILWRNNNYPSTLVPTKVIIDGTEEVFLDTTYSYTLNGQSITLYRFNIVQSDAIQATIDEIRESNLTQLPFIGSLHQIEVVCGGEVVQSFVVPVLNQDSL